MSLRDLVETECGANNSLVQFTGHYTTDKRLVDEGINHPFQNFQDGPSGTNSERCFHMGTLLERIQNISGQSNMTSEVESPDYGNQELVAESLNPLPDDQISSKLSVSAYSDKNGQDFHQLQEFSQGNQGGIWSNDNSKNGDLFSNSMEGFNQMSFNPITGRQADPYFPLHGMEESSWFNRNSSAFTGYQIERNELSEAAANVAQLMGMDTNFINSQFLSSMRELSEHRSTETETFSQMNNIPQDQYDKWADEAGPSSSVMFTEEHSFGSRDTDTNRNSSSTSVDTETFSKNLWTKLTEKWQQLNDSDETGQLIEESIYLPTATEYVFYDENPMIDCEDAMKEGKKRLRTGDLPGAVLCFEAAVQKDKNNVEGWLLLGKTQAENEQDPQAIAALSNCTKLDSGNLEALMTIAASFTNENYHYQACLALKEWMKHNPKYNYLVRNYDKENSTEHNKNPSGLSSLISRKFYDDMIKLYEKAIFQQSYDGVVDADVQNGIGILYTLNNEHDKASEYFKTAVREKNNDPRLWNRLGATLANAQKPNVALEAYRNALTLSPGFIRARYNLGITYLHLNNYKDAIENLLMALNLQVCGRGMQGEKSKIMSDSIWGTLRLALSLSDNKHLLRFAIEKNLTQLNEEFRVNVST